MDEQEQDALSGAEDLSEDFDSLFNFEGEVTAEPQEEQAQDTDADENAQPEPGAPQAQESAQDEPAYKVKYYGEEQEMTVSQLVAAAQKGMDYDNVRTKLEAAQNDPAREFLARVAKESGMEPDEYLQYAKQQLQTQAVQPLLDKGFSEGEAKELLLAREQKASMEAAQAAERQKQKELEPWMALRMEYPELTQLAPQVVERIVKGESPIAAMRAFELEQLRAQLAAQKANEKNKYTTPGSASGLGGKDKQDPFTQGFAAGFDF